MDLILLPVRAHVRVVYRKDRRALGALRRRGAVRAGHGERCRRMDRALAGVGRGRGAAGVGPGLDDPGWRGRYGVRCSLCAEVAVRAWRGGVGIDCRRVGVCRVGSGQRLPVLVRGDVVGVVAGAGGRGVVGGAVSASVRPR